MNHPHLQTTRLVVPLLALVLALPAVAGDEPSPVTAATQSPDLIGILPFDAVTGEGYSSTASHGLAKMVRAEMIRDRRFVPKLIDLPPGERPPLPPVESARLGATAGVDLVLAGSVLDSDVDRKSIGARSGGVLGRVGLGGRLGRTRATVNLQVQLVDPASGEIVKTFEVTAKSSKLTGGTDVWSELGHLDFDDADWARTPVAKALQKAALEIIDKIAEQQRKEASP